MDVHRQVVVPSLVFILRVVVVPHLFFRTPCEDVHHGVVDPKSLVFLVGVVVVPSVFPWPGVVVVPNPVCFQCVCAEG